MAFTDPDGIQHAIEVEADTLYEAVALAVAEASKDELTPAQPAPMTEFIVTSYRKRIRHHIRLNQIIQWVNHSMRDRPAGVIKRDRVRALLEGYRNEPRPSA